MAKSSRIHVTVLATPDSAPKVREEVERQRHFTSAAQDRIQVLEVKEEMRSWTDLFDADKAVGPRTEETNMPGLSGAWLDLCQIAGPNKLGERIRRTPDLCIYDVSVPNKPN